MKIKHNFFNRKCMVSYLLVFSMMISTMLSIVSTKTISMAYTAHTQQDAVNWAASQIGKSLDYDGVYGAQCVDLIKYYYAYLGANAVLGNGCDYATNALPNGWKRYQRTTSDFIPQPGDIAIWTGGYGHVAIVTSSDEVGFNSINQNVKGYVGCVSLWKRNTEIWGVIRPDFPSNNSSSGNTTTGLSYSNLHTTFVDTWNAGLYGKIDNPGRLTVAEVGVWIWDSAGTLVVNHKESCGRNSSIVEQQLNIVGEAFPSGLISGETYTWQMYAIANGTTYKSDTAKFTIVDDQKPVISNVQITNITPEGYTVSCTVTDNYQVDRVQFPTWTAATDANGNDQDDIQSDWGNNSKASGAKNGTTYTYQVKISDHNNESGLYHTHIYAYDKYGNQTVCAAPDTIVPTQVVTTPEPTQAPTATPTPTEAPVVNTTLAPDFESITITDLTDTTANFKVTIPSQYMKSWGWYFGKNTSNLKEFFGTNPNHDVSWMTFGMENLLPNTTYYYYIYYVTDTRTVISEMQSVTTKAAATNNNSSGNTTTVSAPKKVTILSPYSISKKTLHVSWLFSSNTDGYQLQYATNKNFTSAKTITINSNYTTYRNIKNLKSKKTYYVRVRAYKLSNGKTIYGQWSTIKSCKIK